MHNDATVATRRQQSRRTTRNDAQIRRANRFKQASNREIVPLYIETQTDETH
ncbi:hypothetical protein ACS0TY_020695 [Phlomoides rotata]